MNHRILFVTLALAANHQAMAQPGVSTGAPAASAGTVAPATVAPGTTAPVVFSAGLSTPSPNMGSMSPNMESMSPNMGSTPTTTAPISGPVPSVPTPPTAPTTIAPAVPTVSSPTAPRAPDGSASSDAPIMAPIAVSVPTMAPSSAFQIGVFTSAVIAIVAGVWM